MITNFYPAPGSPRSLAVTAAIDRALDHEQILDWYLAGVFLGQSCFGVEGAAMAYFGKTPDALDLAETAYLAGLVVGPKRSPDRLLESRNAILTMAARNGVVAHGAADAASVQPVALRHPLGVCPAHD